LASVIVDRTHTAWGSGMQVVSAAISGLGFAVDLMWHRDLTRICWRRTARSGGTTTGLAGEGSWARGRGSKAVARSLWSKRTKKATGARGRRRREWGRPS
jgi:hypothetical protein